MIKDANHDQINWFRHAAPYINQHRQQRMVIRLEGRLIEGETLERIVHDITLLHALGIQLVLCFGARSAVQHALDQAGISSEILDNDRRVTSIEAMEIVKREIGRLRFDIEAALSRGLANTPMHNASLEVVSGNLVIARPVGIVDGKDLQHSGMIRRVDHASLINHLDQGRLVLMPPMGYSVTGEAFNLLADDVAEATAVAIDADKLIFLDASPTPELAKELIHQVSPREITAMDPSSLHPHDYARLTKAAKAAEKGVNRVHILDGLENGALIRELFTRDGIGCMVTSGRYQNIRQAGPDDVQGIIELIAPLEEQGILVKRPRERLENEVEDFMVIEKDGTIIACAALFNWPQAKAAELACVAVHPDYRRQSLGDTLLEYAIKRAKKLEIERLFVLTTQSAHWFKERQFEATDVSDLPVGRQAVYNLQRASIVLIRQIL